MIVNTWYNGFSPEERDEGDKIIKKAIEEGRLPPLNKTKCCICGQDKGVREYHCEDYSPENILDDVVPLCKKCHMYLHRWPDKWEAYKEEVKKARKEPFYSKYWTEEDDGEVDSSYHFECPKL